MAPGPAEVDVVDFRTEDIQWAEARNEFVALILVIVIQLRKIQPPLVRFETGLAQSGADIKSVIGAMCHADAGHTQDKEDGCAFHVHLWNDSYQRV
jgi:hypothetical protein